ncbi:TIR domain-containing anti-phage reverse transcriptase [Phaeobacter inhibens]|nr:TIR domain-containing anti-phage reverse transcriptase [Phaeobacter inhibens]
MSLPSDFDPAASLMLLGVAHSVQDVAHALTMPAGGLFYVLQNADNGKYYQSFEIPKKREGTRPIDRPVRGLALAQERLAAVLKQSYRPKSFIHGYVTKRSFLTNAHYHEKQKWVLNIDIEDFFGSIGFARIRGLFMSQFFGFNHRVATILARLTTYKDALPQGARTSPILSNIIAHNLDKHLVEIAVKERLKYSRYADDITFSSSRRKIPPSLVRTWEPEYGDREVILGEKITDAFKTAHFRINPDKTRIQLFRERQVVTGLIVNEGANVYRKDISRLRMKLHSGKKFGLEQAAKVWIEPTATAKDYWAHIEGWLGHIKQVRGDDDPVLSKLCRQAADINPAAPKWIIRHAEMVREFDIFLSHASEDKPRVRKLKKKLEAVGIKVFFDEESITWGDSIVQRINHGLLKSTFFVPFLTNTFAAKGWTNKELNSAISANVNRQKRILPICDHDFHVGKNYPMLEDVLYKTWPKAGPKEDEWLNAITDELLALVEKAKLETS